MYYLFSVYFTTLVFSVFNDSAAWDMLDKPGADPEDVSTAREYLIGKDIREISRHHNGFKGVTVLNVLVYDVNKVHQFSVLFSHACL